MKPSVWIATALIVCGGAWALLRPNSSPPIAQATGDAPAAVPFTHGSRAPATRPASTAEPADAATPRVRPARRSQVRGFTSADRRAPAPLSQADTTVADLDQIMPLAREALALVGTDADANEFWTAAINDSDLSAEDRSNLIEDLNEVGFADPDHITATELPLIESRLALIESLEPNAMDDTNAAAFAEAYEDLSRMRNELTPSTPNEPVEQLTAR